MKRDQDSTTTFTLAAEHSSYSHLSVQGRVESPNYLVLRGQNGRPLAGSPRPCT
jgi:hypothetical protein